MIATRVMRLSSDWIKLTNNENQSILFIDASMRQIFYGMLHDKGGSLRILAAAVEYQRFKRQPNMATNC